MSQLTNNSKDIKIKAGRDMLKYGLRMVLFAAVLYFMYLYFHSGR